VRILHITNAFIPGSGTCPEKIGGAEIYAGRVASAQAEAGHEVIVITQCPFKGWASLFPARKKIGQIRVYSFYPLNIFSIYRSYNKPFVLKALWRLIDLVNPLPALMVKWIVHKEKPDIIHSHILHGFSPYFLLRFLSATRRPIVQTLHSYGYLCLRCNLLRPEGTPCRAMIPACRIFIWLSRLLVNKKISLVISPSRFTLSFFEQAGFFSGTQKIVIPNGIETYSVNLHKETEKEFTVFFAGRLTKEKGVTTLIRAFKMLTGENLRLIIAGDGPEKNPLQNLARGDSRIKFQGNCSQEILENFFKTCKVTVVPSLFYENLPNVVLESMRSGTPVIASRIGGLSELIKEGQNGFLFEPGNIEELRKILESLINNPQSLETLGQAAFNFSQGFNLSKHIEALEKVYAETKKSFAGT
jgi:glycosyltransferase involved in cell wall biosynthesis